MRVAQLIDSVDLLFTWHIQTVKHEWLRRRIHGNVLEHLTTCTNTIDPDATSTGRCCCSNSLGNVYFSNRFIDVFKSEITYFRLPLDRLWSSVITCLETAKLCRRSRTIISHFTFASHWIWLFTLRLLSWEMKTQTRQKYSTNTAFEMAFLWLMQFKFIANTICLVLFWNERIKVYHKQNIYYGRRFSGKY